MWRRPVTIKASGSARPANPSDISRLLPSLARSAPIVMPAASHPPSASPMSVMHAAPVAAKNITRG